MDLLQDTKVFYYLVNTFSSVYHSCKEPGCFSELSYKTIKLIHTLDV